MTFDSIDSIREAGFDGFAPVSALRASNCCEVPHEPGWIENTAVLYIGKAGPGRTATLKSRLQAYIQFGQGRPVGHRGGRYIWQLLHSCDLVVCWKATGSLSPRDVEKELIREFEVRYRELPFANINH